MAKMKREPPSDGGWFWMVNLVADKILDIGVPAYVVYTKFACWADKCGECFPSAQTLVDETPYSRRTIFDAIKVLQREGLVIAENQTRPGRGQTSNRYTLTTEEQIPEAKASFAKQEAERLTAKEAGPGVQSETHRVSSRGAARAPSATDPGCSERYGGGAARDTPSKE